MPLIPDDFIQDVLHRVDVVDVVERYLPLKKAGQNYAACCPFHKEKSPSFTVSPTKQFYHCFGCGAHGTAISFVMEYEGLSFVEAVQKLAESAGMRLPKLERGAASKTPDQTAKLQALIKLNERAASHYCLALKNNERAIEYLKRRGLTGRIAQRYRLGYAPEGWQALAAEFSDYASNAGLVEAGLVVDHADTGRRYDRLRDRIVFPILDAKGAVIGFGGRVIDQGEPKYLNSPETPLFHKGRELYGLAQAREAIRSGQRVLVVEGYMDVVALAQLGVEYAVATLGTACTPDHVRKLLRLADEVIFCFDGDKAGRRAAWRALENSLPLATDAKRIGFLFLPSEHDPDSYIRAFGKDAFEALIDAESLGLAAYLVNELSRQVDLDNDEGRARLLHLATPLVEQIQAPAMGLLVRKRLAELTGLAGEEVAQLIVRAPPVSTMPTPRPVAKTLPRFAAPNRRASADLGRELLQLLMYAPKFAHEVPQNLLSNDTGDPTLSAILRVVDFVTEHGAPPLAAHMLAALRDDAVFAKLNEAHTKAEELYGKLQADDAELLEAWSDALRRFLIEQERPRMLQRRAELDARLAAVGLAGLSEAEKDEWRRVSLFR